MTQPASRARVLYAVVCGAAPAAEVTRLVGAARRSGWDVYVIATPAGRDFLDVTALEVETGHPVRSTYRAPDEPRQPAPPADAIIVAPATFNTVNKLVAGIADNYALGLVAECIGVGVPVVVVPFISDAMAARAPLQAAVSALRAESVRVLLGHPGFEPHPVGRAGPAITAFPWALALEEAAAAIQDSKRAA